MTTESPQVIIVNTQPEHVAALAALQPLVFPTLTPDDWFTADMYAAHVRIFPEGQFVALAQTGAGEVVVGATTTFRTNRRFDEDGLFYLEVIGGGWLTTHEPDGAWLYGVDVSVHPDYRRMGIGSRLYDARRALVRRLNLRGELVAGLIPGYERRQERMTVEQYVERVAAGDLTDPTLTMQLRNGFRVQRILRGYVHDARSDDCATLLVRTGG